MAGPRDMLERNQRKLFAADPHAYWRPAQNLEEYARCLAAYHQHLVAYWAIFMMGSFGMNRSEFAKELGLEVETVRRKLRGVTWASAVDLKLWIAAVEISLPLRWELPAPPTRDGVPHQYQSLGERLRPHRG